MIPETGSFFAIDMKPSLFEMSSQNIALPEMASYFLADQEGTLLYCLSSWDYENEAFQRFVDGYREGAVRACRAIYYIDVDKMTVDTVYPLGADGRPRHSTYASEVTDRFKYDVVAEEHKDLVADFLDMGNIIERLEKRDHIELQFKRSMFDVNKREITGRGYEWCSISVTEAERKNGRLTAIAMAIRSIDDVMRREEEQQQMLALAVSRAEAASRAKSDFLSRMSHDIRTPMNAILGMTSIAAMHIDEKSRVLDALEKITVSGKHLLGLINDVLDMSRIESGKISLTEDSFNLSDTIDSVLTVFRSQVEAKQLKLDIQIEKIEHENVIGGRAAFTAGLHEYHGQRGEIYPARRRHLHPYQGKSLPYRRLRLL